MFQKSSFITSNQDYCENIEKILSFENVLWFLEPFSDRNFVISFWVDSLKKSLCFPLGFRFIEFLDHIKNQNPKHHLKTLLNIQIYKLHLDQWYYKKVQHTFQLQNQHVNYSIIETEGKSLKDSLDCVRVVYWRKLKRKTQNWAS
jgi:hypothetical protein